MSALGHHTLAMTLDIMVGYLSYWSLRLILWINFIKAFHLH